MTPLPSADTGGFTTLGYKGGSSSDSSLTGGISPRLVCALVTASVVATGLIVGLCLWSLGGGSAIVIGGTPGSSPLPFGWGRFTQYDPRKSAWSYDTSLPNGPAQWGTVRNASTGALLFPLCADRPDARQSPVDLLDSSPATVPAACPDGCPLSRNYTMVGTNFSIVPRVGGKPGFAIEPNDGVAEWTIEGRLYTLLSFHYHSPSEHTLNGVRMPLEAHFVHVAADGSGDLAVFGIMYPYANDTQVPNPLLRPFWDEIYFPHRLPLSEVNVTGMMGDVLGDPQARYYRYDGSLTTPPCGEGVKWHVAVSRTGINSPQRVLYQYAINMVDNHRGPQPLNGRNVQRYN